MRLKPEKIEHLAKVVCTALEANPDVKLGDTPEKVQFLIKQVITADMKEEEEIEELARKMVEKHMDLVRMKGGSMDTLVQKGKQQIARERRFVL